MNSSIIVSAPPSLHRLSNLPVIGWFFRKGFAQGAFWAILIGLMSSLNDVLMRYLGKDLPFIEIIFFRFLFSLLSILPFMVFQGILHFQTSRSTLHVLRAIFGVGAFFADCYGINHMALNENTILVSSHPLFFLPMAIFFLGEKVNAARWIATSIGFLGILFILQPGMDTVKLIALVPLGAAVQFALLDILTKKMVDTENSYTLLFYFSFGTTLLTLLPTILYWQTPCMADVGLLILLGIGANLVQICLIRSFAATEASVLMPFRYLYFLFSIVLGYALFSEVPTMVTLIGASFIILGTFFVSYKESSRTAVNENTELI